VIHQQGVFSYIWVLSEQIFQVMEGGVFEKKSAFYLGQNGQESNVSVSCLLFHSSDIPDLSNRTLPYLGTTQ
jgi:hypothetical protein